jgi:competence protein ComEA
MHFTRRQIDGMIIVILITAVTCLLSIFPGSASRTNRNIRHGDPREGPVIVKLTGDVEQGGIYYLPESTTIHELFKVAGIDVQGRLDQSILEAPLQTGQTVALDHRDHLTTGQMDAAERLALDLPIDLNGATSDDLMLIPGIGANTAEKIIAFREKSGPFRRVADLKKIPGIKEGKLKQWKRYFYLQTSR